MHTIQLSRVSFSFPGSEPVLENISLSLGAGVIALAGFNGAGKTTLMRLMLRDLVPQQGSISWHGFSEIRFLPQSPPGANTASSGEVKMRYLGPLLNHEGVLFLDEPETHLDSEHRAWLQKALQRRRGLTLLVSHDPLLLEAAEQIIHIEDRKAALFQMQYRDYIAAIDAARARHTAAIFRAEHQIETSQKARRMQLERQLRRSENAARRAPHAGIPRIALGLMKRNAEKTLGKITGRHRRAAAGDAEKLAALRAQKIFRPDFSFAAPKRAQLQNSVLEVERLMLFRGAAKPLWRAPVSFAAKAGGRIWLAGVNGCGKSMLLKTLMGKGIFRHHGNYRHAPGEIRLIDAQHSELDSHAALLDLARAEGIAGNEGATRRLLGAYGFAGDAALRPFASLSGGEKIRLRLMLLAKSPQPPSCIFSDEAEAGLDRETSGLFADFLRDFPGIVVFVSHNESFARMLAPHDRVVLDITPGL